MTSTQIEEKPDMGLFWGCFIALIATAFGFILRALLLEDLGNEFNLTNTQKGEISGVGLWPFAISIVLFSLFIDRIGYRAAMIFAFVAQILSAVITIFFAKGYWGLWIGTFILALGNGAIEAFINPVVATMFSKNKTKWFNTLHAGWPGGMVIGGVFALMLGPEVSWRVKIGLILIPVLLYGFLLWNKKFPVHERVKAGVTYNEMLREVGMGGAFIILWLIFSQLGQVIGWGGITSLIIAVITTLAFGYYIKWAIGQPLYIFLLLIMIPLATTELGTDSWVTDLMGPAMHNIGVQAGWILVYTSLIMAVLRFFSGPIIHKLNPLGLLAVSCVLAILGLFLLSMSAGIGILIAATIYGVGKTYFWPTMLGIGAEQFPKGGALALNIIGGVGMLGVGIVGTVLLGNVQDRSVVNTLKDMDSKNNTTLNSTYATVEKGSIFGKYMALDGDKVAAAAEPDKTSLMNATTEAKKSALRTVALLPVFTLLCFLALVFYFRSKGGYSAVHLE